MNGLVAESLNKSNVYSTTTHHITVNVVSVFEPAHSDTDKHHFVFSYEISIVNLSEFDVQLMSREWYISDYLDGESYVEGEGVIGQQPIIKPGQTFMYSSWCALTSSIGNMKGFYYFNNLTTGKRMKVIIPQFLLMAGFQKN